MEWNWRTVRTPGTPGRTNAVSNALLGISDMQATVHQLVDYWENCPSFRGYCNDKTPSFAGLMDDLKREYYSQ
jgi:hypothetical protein